uniref:Uncharacterized protein n=1 Tax=Timema poppense TaxID=170557 RepID=A0A7R9DKF8_TIMPO|nr:unnamed protein product [Timema poppensis]
MGDRGTSDRPGRHTTLGVQDGLAASYLEKKSSSEPELNAALKEPQQQYWTTFGRGFPPGVTVDELFHYRRRRAPGHLRPQDNLHPEGGTLKALKSEYRRCFHTHDLTFDKENESSNANSLSKKRQQYPLDSLKLEGEFFLQPEYFDTFVDFPRQRPFPTRPRTQIHISNDDINAERMSESITQYVCHPGANRAELARIPTSLRSEGEMLMESEFSSSYIIYKGSQRAESARRNTSLKMEGGMESTTENMEKFVKYISPKKSELARRTSNLRMEGDMEKISEIRAKYIGFVCPKRAVLMRRPTSLHLEGDIERNTEKRAQFIEFLKVKRTEISKHTSNLKLEGELEHRPEYRDFFIDFPRARPLIHRPICNLKPEGIIENMTEKRAQFVEYLLSQCSRSEIMKMPSSLKIEGEQEYKSEYREIYTNFPRERPTIAKQREGNLKLEGDIDLMTETNSQFVNNPGSQQSEIAAGERVKSQQCTDSLISLPHNKVTERNLEADFSDKAYEVKLSTKIPVSFGKLQTPNFNIAKKFDTRPEHEHSQNIFYKDSSVVNAYQHQLGHTVSNDCSKPSKLINDSLIRPDTRKGLFNLYSRDKCMEPNNPKVILSRNPGTRVSPRIEVCDPRSVDPSGEAAFHVLGTTGYRTRTENVDKSVKFGFLNSTNSRFQESRRNLPAQGGAVFLTNSEIQLCLRYREAFSPHPVSSHKLPVIGSLVYCESDPLELAATEVA